MAVQRKFGRIPEFDARSRNYPIRPMIPRGTVPRSYTWSCGVVLDQGATPACTGFSVAHEAAARPCVVPNMTNAIGQMLYKRAKQLDEWPGEDYDGSSVLGAVKAGAEKGWYPSYRWAFSESDLCLAVGYKGPAVLGINWYDGMYQTDAKGMIQVSGKILGGHAILCNGYNVKTKLYRLHNSWGPTWGLKGEAFISQKDMGRLLAEEGEACIPIVRHL
jgi:hypothetical protein